MKEFAQFQEQSPIPEEEMVLEEEVLQPEMPPQTEDSHFPEQEEAVPEETPEETGASREEPPPEETSDEEVPSKEITGNTEEPVSAGPTLAEVLESQSQLLQKVEELQGLFQSRILHTDHEDQIIDQMHRELQKHREGLYAQLIRPILLDIIQVRDSILRLAAAYLEKPEGQQSIPNKTFSAYALDLQDILERNEVEVFTANPGEDFAPLRQRVVKKVPTEEEELHSKVAASLSDGYLYGGRTLSPEKVAVYTYEKPVQKTDQSEEMNNG